jgi:hypothetical protein
VIAPGIERFEYFRKITRIARGQEPPESLRDVQELYDTYFLNSPEWEARRLNNKPAAQLSNVERRRDDSHFGKGPSSRGTPAVRHSPHRVA